MSELNTSTVESTRTADVYTPRFDVWETGEAVILRGDLPGVSAESLEVRYEDGELTLVGKVEQPVAERQYLLNEYGVGDFQRSFHVGDTIDSPQITAELKHGELTVTMPKSSSVRSRRVEVKQG